MSTYTNTDWLTQLAADVAALSGGTMTQAAFIAALLPYTNGWIGIASSDMVLAQKVTDTVAAFVTRDVNFDAWINGTATGGYTDNTGTTLGGPYYKLTTLAGGAQYLICPAGLAATMAKGDPGGIAFVFSTTTTDADPGNGKLRFNNAARASVTQCFFDNLEAGGGDVTAWLDSLDDIAATTRGTLYMQETGSVHFAVFTVTGPVVNGTGYRKVPVAYVSGPTLFTNAARVSVMFSAACADAVNYATKTDDFASASDNSAKSWAIGGTGNGQPTAGPAKDWATKTGAFITGTSLSALEWAVGTFKRGVAGFGSAKDWATLTGATADNAEYSSKEYAQGTTVTTGSAKSWAQLTGAFVTGSLQSAQEWAVGTFKRGVAGFGSAKDWATLTGAFADDAGLSAKEWALGTWKRGVATFGSAKDWATLTGATVDNAALSAKEWAIGTFKRGVAGFGSAMDWAILTGQTVDGTNYSAKSSALDAGASAAAAAALVATALTGGQDLGTRAGWAAISIPATMKSLRTNGDAVAGDGAAALWIRCSGPTVYPGTYFRSTDRFMPDGSTDATFGGYWLYIPDPDGVNVKVFGALGTGAIGVARAFSGPDDISPLQKAFDAALYYYKCSIVIPAGIYRTTKALQIGWGTTSVTPHVTGAGARTRGEANFAGTAILCDFSDQPGLALNFVRAARLKGIAVIGQNFNWIESQNLGGSSPTRTSLSQADWVDTALNANANSRYAVYGGIELDPYGGTQPATHYPDLTPPAWLSSWSGQYGKSGSSDVQFDDVMICGFVVGYANQPSDFDSNGDFPKFSNVVIEKCMVGVSIGNDQCRDLDVRGINMSQVHTCFTGVLNGRQDGKLQGLISGQLSNCIQWIDHTDSATGGPLTFQECYGEGVFKLGRWQSGGSGASQLVLDNCTVNFTGQSEGAAFARGRPRLVLDATAPSLVVFRGGKYTNYLGIFMLGGRAADYSFEGAVVFTPASTPSSPVQRIFRNFLAGVGFEIDVTNPVPERFHVSAARYSQSASLGTETLGEVIPLQRNHPACAWSRRARPINDPSYVLPIPSRFGPKSKTSFSSVSITGLEVTLVFSSLNDDVAAQAGWRPGCAIWDDDSKVWMRIHSRTTTTVIATIVTGYVDNGTTVTLEQAFSTSAGNLYAGNALLFLPSDYVQGDTDSTSSTIANVGKADLNGTFLTTELAAGDYILANSALDGYIASNKSLLSAVTNGSPGSLTLTGTNKPAQTITRKPLGFFLQTSPVNE